MDAATRPWASTEASLTRCTTALMQQHSEPALRRALPCCLMQELPWLLIGIGIGALAAAGVAWATARRHLGRIREAEQRARIAERMAEIGAMTGGLAHEIKNPLSTIGLNAQLLAEGLDDLPIDAEERGRLSRRIGALRREVERLRGILTDFLQFAGQVRLEPRPTDLNQVVEELVDFFLPQAERQGVRLRTDLAPGPLTASLDGPHLKQAVLNLMLNGVQAMSEGSGSGKPRELILKTERGGDRRGGPRLLLHVIDTGPGMDAAMQEKIFQPYFTTKSGGTGLGLPTARRLVEAHGGTLQAVSETGRGTDFVVSLPLEGVGEAAA
jgi:signal transduction histidine kinase